MNKGMSLIEILVVVAVFAILGVIVTQAVTLTLRGSKKSESQVRVRENLSYALSVMERQLRNANAVTVCDTGLRVEYKDSKDYPTSFSCETDYVASGSARLTSDEIRVTACSISCPGYQTSSNPPYIDIFLSGEEASVTGVEGASVSAQTKVYLRTY